MAKATQNKGAKAPAKTATTAPTAPTANAVVAAPPAPALPWVGVQNGVQPPKRAGLCAAVWAITSTGITQTANGPLVPPLAMVKAAGAAQGLNPQNVSIEYYRCRQWHGVRGRQAQAPAPAAQ